MNLYRDSSNRSKRHKLLSAKAENCSWRFDSMRLTYSGIFGSKLLSSSSKRFVGNTPFIVSECLGIHHKPLISLSLSFVLPNWVYLSRALHQDDLGTRKLSGTNIYLSIHLVFFYCFFYQAQSAGTIKLFELDGLLGIWTWDLTLIRGTL